MARKARKAPAKVAAPKVGDYAPEALEALARLKAEAQAFHAMLDRHGKQDAARTATMVTALVAAEDSGLLVEARTKEGRAVVDAGGMSYTDLGRKAGVTGGVVTRWRSLGQAVRIGATPGTPAWDGLALGQSPAIRSGEVREMISKAKSPTDIVKGLEALGFDPAQPGRRLQGRKAQPEGKGAGKSDAPEETPVDAFTAAKQALRAFDEAAKSPKVQHEEWETLRRLALAVVKRQSDRRGVRWDTGEAKPTRKVATPKVATPKDTTSHDATPVAS